MLLPEDEHGPAVIVTENALPASETIIMLKCQGNLPPGYLQTIKPDYSVSATFPESGNLMGAAVVQIENYISPVSRSLEIVHRIVVLCVDETAIGHGFGKKLYYAVRKQFTADFVKRDASTGYVILSNIKAMQPMHKKEMLLNEKSISMENGDFMICKMQANAN